jgi:hypothetical protein
MFDRTVVPDKVLGEVQAQFGFRSLVSGNLGD